MPKRRDKRQQRTLNRPARPAVSAGPPTDFPSAPTLFRLNLLDRRTHALLRHIPADLKPILLARDREPIELVKQAATPAALIDLASLAAGLAETTWHNRMRELGPEAIPLIAERLSHADEIRDAGHRTRLRENLIGHLRWRDDAGAEALLACFDTLDDYSRSLACVVLGLLGARSGAGKIWHYYQKVVRNTRESYLVGALWGLIDLQDEHIGGALVEYCTANRCFTSYPGFWHSPAMLRRLFRCCRR